MRVWIYARPAVVLGASQRTRPDMEQRAAACDVELCTRPTGGGAVLAGPWLLGVSVVLPAGHVLVCPAIVESFRWFGEAHQGWLRSLGLDCRCIRPGDVGEHGPERRWACFGALSHWEVAAGRRKIVGLSQARKAGGTLFSSGILIAPPPWSVLCDVMGMDVRHAAMLEASTISCAQLLRRAVDPGPLAASLGRALCSSLEGAGMRA
ncbi:MAG TPA: ligase [Ramlibacter sp.]